MFPSCHSDIDPQTSFCPIQRYCEWDYYDSATRRFLRRRLNYRENTWDYDGVKNEDLEMTSFEDLLGTVRNALESIGFDEDSHDCCQVHYEDYDWSDFSGSDMADVKSAWILLGFNQRKWDNGASGDFDDFDWDDLSNKQQEALFEHLCYTKELWNEEPISDWPDDAILPGTDTSTTSGTSLPTASPTAKRAESNSSFDFFDSIPPLFVIRSPTAQPSAVPSVALSTMPSASPSALKSALPSAMPSALLSSIPSVKSANMSTPAILDMNVSEVITTSETNTTAISSTESPTQTPSEKSENAL